MIFIYLILILLFSPNIYSIFKIILKDEINVLNKEEKLCFSIISSFLLYVLYLFVVGIINIKYNRIVVVVPFVINIIILIFNKNFWNGLRQLLKINKNPMKSYKLTPKSLIYCLLVFSVTIYLTYIISTAISNFLSFPDEFSVWALNAKNIFIGRKMNFFINTGLENYPNFLPLLYSGFYFFIDKIEENSIRIISGIYLSLCVVGLIGFGKRKKINLNYMLIFIMLCIILYGTFADISSSSYADIPFMTTYTFGILYFIEYLVSNRNKTFLAISSISFMSCSFMKTDGLYLMAFNLFLSLLYGPFSKIFKLKRISPKESVVYNLLIFLLPVTWKIYNKLADFPTNLVAGAGSVFELHLEYLIGLFTNMTSQFYDCIPWVIVLIILLIGYLIFYNKLSKADQEFINLCCFTFFANLMFLILCYLFVFGGEAIIAASFIRYLTRVIMIMIMASLIMLKPINKER